MKPCKKLAWVVPIKIRLGPMKNIFNMAAFSKMAAKVLESQYNGSIRHRITILVSISMFWTKY